MTSFEFDMLIINVGLVGKGFRFTLLNSKIHRVAVIDCQLHGEGSYAIDRAELSMLRVTWPFISSGTKALQPTSGSSNSA